MWHVISCTGWRYDQVLEDMDVPRLEEMNAYHLVSPPLHMMVKAYLGAGKKPPKKVDHAAFAELAKMTDGQTAPNQLAAYSGGRMPKIGESLWQVQTKST